MHAHAARCCCTVAITRRAVREGHGKCSGRSSAHRNRLGRVADVPVQRQGAILQVVRHVAPTLLQGLGVVIVAAGAGQRVADALPGQQRPRAEGLAHLLRPGVAGGRVVEVADDQRAHVRVAYRRRGRRDRRPEAVAGQVPDLRCEACVTVHLLGALPAAHGVMHPEQASLIDAPDGALLQVGLRVVRALVGHRLAWADADVVVVPRRHVLHHAEAVEDLGHFCFASLLVAVPRR
mmetsp:Transcript_74677/g.192709  ORF Transcript_74677/g.192709 Transcript_74677/m.192709 type:complete len:235 (+) Transcript_74677:136-840(+)